MNKKIIYLLLLFFICFSLFADNELEDFHNVMAGIWDTEENLIDKGYTGKRSWGDTNKSVSSLLIIDLLWREGNQVYKDRIFFSNDTYFIKECYQMSDSSFIVLIEASSKRREPNENYGYYNFVISNEHDELMIRHIDYSNSSEFDIDFTAEYLESKLIFWEKYHDTILQKRSGPGFNYFDGK